MRTIFLLLFALSFLGKSSAQTSHEALINDIYSSFVDSSYTAYFLYEECSSLHQQAKQKENFESFKSFISDDILSQLLDKATKDTLPMQWDCSGIDKAKCINKSTNKGILVVQLSSYPNKKARKKIEKENRQINKKPEYERRLYSFSRPILDDNNEYALIEMKCTYGSSYYDNYFKCIFLLKNTDGEWSVHAKTDCFGM